MASTAQEKGRVFEDFVGEVVQAFSRRHGLKCDRFGPSYQPDGGKDFAIVTPASLKGAPRLFGVNLRSNARYVVEAKYVDTRDGIPQKLGFSRFISNLSQVKADKVAGLFLATSTQINPQSLYAATAVAESRDFLFSVPGAWLNRLAEDLGVVRRSDVEISPLAGVKLDRGVIADVHAVTRRAGGSELRYYYVALYNDGDAPKAVEILGQTAEDWSFVDAEITGDQAYPHLEAFDNAKKIYERTETIDSGRVFSLALVGRMRRGRLSATDARKPKTEVRIIARCGDTVKELARQNTSFEPIYLPRFMGAGHRRAAARISEAVATHSRGPRVILVTGEAGVGKSRTVDEALNDVGDAQIDVFSFTLESVATRRRRGGGTGRQQAFDDFAKTVTRTAFGQEASRDPLQGCLSVADVIARVRDYRRGKLAENLNMPVFVIEDLHHVEAGTARDLAALVLEAGSDEPPCMVILTGRDDNTFDNRYCWTLYADLKKDIAAGHDGALSAIRIEPLDARSAQAMVGSIIDEIQESAIDRILRLSGPIPNNIVQCIEFLLDQSLIEIASNATLSIVDQLTFERRSQTLPSSMAELLVRRFDLLGNDAIGERAKHAIVAATIFGTYIPKSALELDFDASGIRLPEVAEHLVRRRFFRRSRGSFFEWSHESLLLHFDAAVRSTHFGSDQSIARYVEPAARAVTTREAVFRILPRLDQGRAAALAGQCELAIERYASMLETLRGLSSFAGAEIKADYYDHADPAIAVLSSRSEPDEKTLVALLGMKAYVGAVFRSLVFCEAAYRTGREWLRRISLSDAAKARARYWLDQILTQCLMDSGFPGVALRSALELEARLPFVPQIKSDMAFVFDVHNTLRLIYTYTNFYVLAEAQGHRAAEAARLSGDRELQAMDLGDRALLYFYNDWERCRSLNLESLAIRRTLPAPRGAWHSEVSTIAIDLSARQSDREWLVRNAEMVEDIIKDCRYNRYHSVLPRIYLLQAALFDLLQRIEPHNDRWRGVDEMIDLGLDACERFSIGYVSWQLQNLKAVRAARRGEWRMATRAIRTAATMIHKEGLTFLGDGPLVSAVPIVLANFIKIMRQASTDREIATMLGQIRGFARYDLAERQARLRCEEQAQKTAAILSDNVEGPPFSLLLDMDTSLGITVWF